MVNRIPEGISLMIKMGVSNTAISTRVDFCEWGTSIEFELLTYETKNRVVRIVFDTYWNTIGGDMDYDELVDWLTAAREERHFNAFDLDDEEYCFLAHMAEACVDTVVGDWLGMSIRNNLSIVFVYEQPSSHKVSITMMNSKMSTTWMHDVVEDEYIEVDTNFPEFLGSL